LDAAIDELGAAGIHDITRSYGSKHLQLRWPSPSGMPRMVSMSVTPSDQFAPQKVRADIRRILRADGLLVDQEPPRARPRGRVVRLEQRLAALEIEVAQLRNGGGRHDEAN
jgi:hypothetical protein